MHSPGKIIELLLKIEYLVTCKSKATGTSTSKLGYHFQTESLTFLSAQTILQTLPNAIKRTGRVDSTVAMVAMRYAKPRMRVQYIYYF